jgi:hypothetical protein
MQPGEPPDFASASELIRIGDAISDADGFDLRWDGAFIASVHWHFHRRLYERYRIVLAPGEFSQIARILEKNTGLFVSRRETAGIYVFKLERLNRRIFVLSENGSIISAWPPTKDLRRKWRNMKRAAERGRAPRSRSSSHGE